MGLINDPNYCDFVDSYNLIHPENLFYNENYMTDYNPGGLLRNSLKERGSDVLPEEASKDMEMDLFNSRSFMIPINTTMIFTKKVASYYFHEFGKNLYC